jgi:hypothetical protein
MGFAGKAAAVSVSGDLDFWLLDVTVAGSLYVDCYFTHAEGDIDIVLYDSAYNELAGSYGIADDEYIGPISVGPGLYYVEVYNCDIGVGTPYTVAWAIY